MFRVLASSTFAKQFRGLSKADQRRIHSRLAALAEDPRTPRAGLDIKPLQATEPPKHRLRVGAYRVIYVVDKKTVKLLEVFRRGRGYRE